MGHDPEIVAAPRAPHRFWTTPMKVAGTYLVVSVAWILFTDRTVEWLGLHGERATRVQSAKGLVFVVLSAGVIYTFVRREFRTVAHARDHVLEREELLRNIITHIPCGVFWKDRDSVYLGCNDQVALDRGLPSPADVVGRDDRAISVNPSEAAFYRECDRRVVETGTPHLHIEESLTRRNGDTATLLTSKVPLRNAAGEVVGVLGVYQDITARKLAEGQLGFQNSVLDAITTGAPLDDVLNLLARRVEKLGRELLCSILLLNDDGKTLRHCAGPSLPAKYREAIQVVPVGPTVGSCGTAAFRRAEVIVADIASDPLWAAYHQLALPHGLRACWSSPIFGRDGRVLATFAVYYRTPRGPTPAERQLIAVATHLVAVAVERWRDREALLLRDRAIQAVSQGILITDPAVPDNPVVYASPGFFRLTGYQNDEVLGRNCRFLQGPGTDLAVVASVRESIAAGRVCAVELLNYRKDGTAFWNGLHIAPLRDETGRVTHFVGVQSDVTERRLLEERLRQEHKMTAIGQLAGGVAHDFNNLLTVINGSAELAAELVPADHAARPLLAEVLGAGERAAELTRKLLAFGRKQILRQTVLDLREMVSDFEGMLRRVIGEDVALVANLGPDLLPVRADPGQLQQVVMNLAVNARDAMPRGGRLTIETQAVVRDEARFALLAVADTGDGMSDEIRSRVFEPFFTTKELGKGSGLGLAVVHGIIEQSGGTVEVASRIGAGTTIRVYLPLVEDVPTRLARPPARHEMPRGTETVLLVEDNDELRTLARRVLQGAGYEVLEATGGERAYEFIESRGDAVDLLITDVVMPDQNGSEVAERLHSLRPGLRVLYMSGYTDDAVVRHGVASELVDFLQKPFSPGELTRKVREVLDAER